WRPPCRRRASARPAESRGTPQPRARTSSQRAGASCLDSEVVRHLVAAAVGHLPSPDLLALAARDDTGLVDLRDDAGVAREQRLGRAHLRARRELALGDAVAAVLAEFLDGEVLLGTAGAVGALVHLAA